MKKYHEDCYKYYLLKEKKCNLTCGYCNKEIFNNNMKIEEIIEIMKTITPLNKLNITYHIKCLQDKIYKNKIFV
jgi:molybdenum cofactor biosynthesis enzyme MoaA